MFPLVLPSNIDSQDWMRAARLQTLEDDEGKRDVLKETPWQQMSWKTVNCCQKLDDDKVWEDEISGVPDCFCRDVLSRSRYKTTAVCNLRQVLVLDPSVCPCMCACMHAFTHPHTNTRARGPTHTHTHRRVRMRCGISIESSAKAQCIPARACLSHGIQSLRLGPVYIQNSTGRTGDIISGAFLCMSVGARKRECM